MKSLTFFFFALLALNLYSKDYEPLLSETKYWDIVYWADGLNGGGMFVPEYAGERQYIEGDTTINSKKYKIIRAKALNPINEPSVFYPPFSISENSYIKGFMREDSINKKVYTYDSNEDIEYLTYNFNINLGDSLVVNYLGTDTIVLDSIVSLNLNNGSHVKKYYFNMKGYLNHENDYYIAGIGGASSLMYPFDYNFESGSSLDGVIIENEKVYCQNNNCYVITSNSQVELNSAITVYPNPLCDRLSVKNNFQQDGIVNLINSNGKLLLKKAFIAKEGLFEINMSEFSSGLYILNFITSDNTITKTILKK